MPRFSVIIPVYNVEKYLRACIDSVLGQKGAADYEIILVDDGSPDRSGFICDEYAAEHSNVCVIHQENRWLSGARNTGLRAARGEYVLFLDSDDSWEPGLLEALDGLLACKADMAYFGHVRICEGMRRVPSPLKVLPGGESGEAWLNRMFEVSALPCIYACCYAYRRAFIQEHQLGFREDLRSSEDFEFNMRAFPLAKSIVGTDTPYYNYYFREGSLTTSISSKKLMDNLICKAEVFARYRVAALANIYADYALQVSVLPRKEAGDVQKILKQNRRILDYVSQPPLKLGQLLVRLLGDYTGSQIYRGIRYISRRLRGNV